MGKAAELQGSKSNSDLGREKPVKESLSLWICPSQISPPAGRREEGLEFWDTSITALKNVSILLPDGKAWFNGCWVLFTYIH